MRVTRGSRMPYVRPTSLPLLPFDSRATEEKELTCGAGRRTRRSKVFTLTNSPPPPHPTKTSPRRENSPRTLARVLRSPDSKQEQRRRRERRPSRRERARGTKEGGVHSVRETWLASSTWLTTQGERRCKLSRGVAKPLESRGKRRSQKSGREERKTGVRDGATAPTDFAMEARPRNVSS